MTEIRWAMTSISDSDIDPPGSKIHQLVNTANLYKMITDSKPQRQGASTLLPPMSHQTHIMAEHNIQSALSAMENKNQDVEAYIRAEVVRWEERVNWDIFLPGAPTEPNSPDQERNPGPEMPRSAQMFFCQPL